MANASYQRFSFLGGEISPWAQGRVDRDQYLTSMNVCLNGHPVEAGTWVRRPGTAHAYITRGALPGRVLRFDFQASTPYTIETTDGFMRFRVGTRLATTNDVQTALAVSTANPAVVQTSAAHGWVTGNTVVFSFGNGMLDNRQFLITVIDATHFSLRDPITGVNINGTGLGFISGLVSRIQELTTPYTFGSWQNIRIIQAETTAVLLASLQPPQILTVPTLPGVSNDALFSLATVVFLDGPYLDPPTNGAQVTPGGTTGIVTLTLGFPAYSATKAYKVGDFVVSGGINYISRVDQNLNNTPAGSPSQWAPTSAGAAINNGQGWLGTDVGRLVRLFSEPPLWLVTTAYTTNQVVSYNPSGTPNGATYWSCKTNNTGNAPGIDLVNWSVLPINQAAVWSWGKIVSLGNQISQTVAGVSNIGDMVANGGLAAAFDGITSQVAAACAASAATSAYVGRHFGGGAQAIGSVTVYPSSDGGFSGGLASTVILNLYAKNTAPASATDGTLLGTSGSFTDGLAAKTILSNSAASWNYVWVQISFVFGGVPGDSASQATCAELQLFNPPGTGSGTVANLEILGPALLYTTPCITWRLGVYSGATGYPTCGCYHEGRIWLGGAVANRFDASVSNGIVGNTINFAPTDQYGTVGAANGISEVLNSDGVNPISWMIPDLVGVVMGTLAGEWLIEPLAAGAIAPNNIAARPIPKIGCANIQPVRTEHTVIFAHRYRRKLMEGFSDVFNGKFSAPNLTRWAMHMTKPLVAELAYTDAVTPTVWARCDDGSWFGIVYKRDKLATAEEPTYAGFFRCTLGSGRIVTSICSGPSVGGTRDALTLVTQDPASGLYQVEILTDVLDEGSTLTQAAYLDNAVSPSYTTSVIIPSGGSPTGGLTCYGLWHLNGKSVVAWIAGIDCGNYTVANGNIFVPYGDGISVGTGTGLFTAVYYANQAAVIGFDYNSDGQPVEPVAPQESGARSGPAIAKKQRNHYIFAKLEGAQGISFGANLDSTLKLAIFTQPNKTPYLVNQQFTGTFRDQFTSDYDFGVKVAWRVNRGYPANVVSIGAAIETQDI